MEELLMTIEQTTESEVDPKIETLFRYVGLSFFYYYLTLIIFSIIQYFFTREFTLDLTFILYFWMAYAIKDRSLTACKWGVFCMLLHGGLCIAICCLAILNPSFLVFESGITSKNMPFYFILCLFYAIWSLVNLKYLIRIFKLHTEKFWPNGPIWIGAITTCVIIGFLVVPPIVNYCQRDYRLKIESQYSEVIDYLIQASKNDMPTATNSSEVVALSEAYPHILYASFEKENKWRCPIINKGIFERTSYSGNSGSGVDHDGNEIKFDIYEDIIKDKESGWIKITLHIKQSKFDIADNS
ncbi:MAG: hypothetical protein ACYTER_08815 [Planctomycetota bacterium]